MSTSRIYFAIIVLLVIFFFISLLIGVVNFTPFEFLSTESNNAIQIVIFQIRLPRSLMALLVGGSLGISGAAIQGFFRNPLAETSILGISSGAMLFTIISIVILNGLNHSFFHFFLNNLSGFIGALVVMSIVIIISNRLGNKSSDLLLAGIAISALCGGLTSIFIQISNNHQLRNITFWSMGSLSATNWNNLISFLPFAIFPTILIFFQHKKLDVLLLGEVEAKHLGINLKMLKISLLIAIALQIGASVALCGTIGFVGLIAPHVAKLVFASKQLDIFIGAFLFGMLLLLISDTLARTIFQPIELPIGVITTCLGVPLFLYLLFKRKMPDS